MEKKEGLHRTLLSERYYPMLVNSRESFSDSLQPMLKPPLKRVSLNSLHEIKLENDPRSKGSFLHYHDEGPESTRDTWKVSGGLEEAARDANQFYFGSNYGFAKGEALEARVRDLGKLKKAIDRKDAPEISRLLVNPRLGHEKSVPEKIESEGVRSYMETHFDGANVDSLTTDVKNNWREHVASKLHRKPSSDGTMCPVDHATGTYYADGTLADLLRSRWSYGTNGATSEDLKERDGLKGLLGEIASKKASPEPTEAQE